MVFSTSFTKAFNLTAPICLAPMAGASGGRLAAAVARGGGLGVIAAGSGKDTRQLDKEVRIFRNEAPTGAKLAIGIISWSALGGGGYGITQASLRRRESGNWRGALDASSAGGDEGGSNGSFEEAFLRRESGLDPEEAGRACSTKVLEVLLERYQPHAIWFFAPATPCKEAYSMCLENGVDVIAQIGTVGQARTAVEMGASVIVAQGREAGGHGLRSEVATGTLPLAAAVAVELAESGRPVLAAGGVVNGKGLLAALALGCDGVVMGTRYCATNEALGSDDHKAKLVSTSGDETVRTMVFDMAAAARPVNSIEWPDPYDSSGVAANTFTKRWHTREESLSAELSHRDEVTGHSAPTAQLDDAERTRDLTVGKVYMGEGAGLIYSVEEAEKVTVDVAREAEEQLNSLNRLRRLTGRNHDLDVSSHMRGSGSSTPMASLSNDNIEALDQREGMVRDRRANTASALLNPVHIPGTRQVISSGSLYEKQAGYSRAVRVGKHVQVAGTTATSPDGSGVLCVGDVGGQAQYIFHIIALALREAKCSLENVVRTRMYVTDMKYAEVVMAEHFKVFANIRPAATLVMVSALVHPDLLVEVEADALEP